VLINEGRAAGASLPHSHSQLVWLRDPPPAVAGEAEGGLRELVAAAREAELGITRRADVAAFAHPAGRLPYEATIASEEQIAPWPDGAALISALEVLRDAVRRLQRVEGPVPWNAWLHHGIDWHIELVPRLATLAGIELGAGIYVNTVAPKDAAAALRAAD
jgi:UDPglucose--hexose-1-phosphate uridylyltransferase